MKRNQKEGNVASANAGRRHGRRTGAGQQSRPAGKGGWTNDGSSRLAVDSTGSGHVAAGYNGNSVSCA